MRPSNQVDASLKAARVVAAEESKEETVTAAEESQEERKLEPLSGEVWLNGVGNKIDLSSIDSL